MLDGDHNMDTKKIKIGDIAKKLGINIQTIRYYERIGMIAKPERSLSGYRYFTEDFVKRIEFIKKAQQIGFSLDEIKELLKLKVSSSKNSKRVREKTEQKLNLIDKKLARLTALKKVLKELVSVCEKKGTTQPCPILQSLDEEDNCCGND